MNFTTKTNYYHMFGKKIEHTDIIIDDYKPLKFSSETNLIIVLGAFVLIPITFVVITNIPWWLTIGLAVGTIVVISGVLYLKSKTN